MSMISELVKELRWIADYEYQSRNSEDTIRRAADTIEMLSKKVREPKQEWIPCEERLPIDGEECLVSVNAIDDIPYKIVISDSVSYCYERGWATAWMPLPEPWKGADDE